MTKKVVKTKTPKAVEAEEVKVKKVKGSSKGVLKGADAKKVKAAE